MKKDTINVLLVEDNPDDAEILRLTLSKEINPKFEVEWVERLSLGQPFLADGKCDVALLDLFLPDSRGIETFNRLHAANPSIPIIVLTGINDETLALEAMQRGAQDYLVKGRVDKAMICRTMQYAIHRQMTEESLRTSKSIVQEEMDLFFSLSLDMFCVAGFDGFLKVLNPAWEKSLGWPLNDLLSRPLLEFVHESDKQQAKEQLQKLAHGEPLIHFECRFLCKGGGAKWLQWDANPLPDQKKIYAVARDVTEKKRSEERLREMGIALENSAEGIGRSDVENNFVAVNPALAGMLGYSPQDLLGKSCVSFVNEEDRDKVKTALDNMLRNGKSSVELKGLKKDGQTIFVEVDLVKTSNELGEFTGHYSFVKDITPRKLAEARQQQLLAKLEKANRELNDFAYVVSHDLKAPLRGIGSLADWLSTDYADKLDAEGKENLSLLVGRVKRMHDLIDGLLQLAKVGRVEEEKEQINLNQVVKETLDLIPLPPTIQLEVEDHLPEIVFSKVRIQQVFQNLVSNAVKYMDKPQGKIKIESEDGGPFWKFKVHDNAPGIEKQHYEKIFRIFQTLQPRDSCESTGIGLSLVKKIVETNHGSVGVESNVGEGSTFFFTVPKNTKPGGTHDHDHQQAA